jgi:hypothetical protein
MTNTDVLMQEIKNLPPDYVDRVLDFVEHLKKRPLSEPEFEEGLLECPLDHTPNAETIAAMQEGDAILKGEIPAAMTINLSRYKTHEERKAALRAAFEEAEQN